MLRLKVRRFFSLPDLTVLLIEIFINIYTQSIGKCFTHGRKQSVRKTPVVNFWSVDESVSNKFTKGFTDGRSVPKTIIRFIPSIFAAANFPYNQWNTVCNSICVFICPLVYLLVNITYHWQNIIYNSIEELIIAMTFAVILFQLSRIYRRMWFVDNPVSNILKYFFKKILNRSRKIIKIKSNI